MADIDDRGPRIELVRLTGRGRGSREVVGPGPVRLGSGPGADVHFPPDAEPAVAGRHARILRDETGWRIQAEGAGQVFVNGRAARSRRLDEGDVIQLGEDGPVLKLRAWSNPGPYKGLREAVSDCVDCARYGADSAPGRAGLFLRSMPRELGRTAPSARFAVAGVLVLLLGGMGYLYLEGRSLERRLAVERERIQAVAASLEAERSRPLLDSTALDSLRSAVAARVRRGRPDAGDLVARSVRSVVFIQGSYGFVDTATGRSVRVGRDAPVGETPTRPSPSAPGPELERRFTGTGFVVEPGGHVVTNRHVAEPWGRDDVDRSLMGMGYRPVMRRMVGYLPGRQEPFTLETTAASESADVAILDWPSEPDAVPGLPVDTAPPAPGEDVYVLGYPTGIQALLARTSPSFVDSLRRDPEADFWTVARRLAGGGRIQPLVTRGIVGQVTRSAVVYDAETARGGSGGPVLSGAGRVVAVNRAVMEEFGGSNIGVPARELWRLLERTGARD